MPGRTTKVLTGVALAALAAAGVAAVVNYRQGKKADPLEHAHLAALDARLNTAEETIGDRSADGVRRVFDGLHRNRGISVAHLRNWVAGVRQGNLSAEEAIVAESDFGALERDADQGGV